MLPLIAAMLMTAGIGAFIWIRNGIRKQYKERGWAMFILLIGALLIAGMMLGLPIPNPLDMIMAIFKPVYKPLIAWIEKG
ncbi:hypothetical protein [Paenibacillus harenae]|uniref:Uncharacterized protein n=1 Tax=Paenibacillus harenae TaxID=306543 RepID=A0ABT9U1V3_PAEHA|nr:hypothetical protein [Paenibacillus harenae]MDQ0061975.1 hypothetical protein [Paenibacillus harenae]MDQ0113597.1 hypothetical protein [Paenibacillus harenae]